MSVQRIEFLGLPLDTGLTTEGICDLLRQKGAARTVAYISPSSWAVAKRHPAYLPAMRQMSTIRAGGEGVARVCRWLMEKDCRRINFDMTSLAGSFFKKVVAEQASIMLVGGRPGIGDKLEAKLKQAYPGINIIGTQHGYGDFEPKVAAIKDKAPEAVIVAMGSPQQEFFILSLQQAGYQGMAVTCGGFFDQYLENTDYYPDWVNKWDLRFAYRLFREPRRLWRRYLIDYQLFIWETIKACFKKGRTAFLHHLKVT